MPAFNTMPLTPDDAYFLPDGRMVMTATYHIKRGVCCHQQCRHCPYPLPPDGQDPLCQPSLDGSQ